MNEIISFKALLTIIFILSYCSPNTKKKERKKKKRKILYFPSVLFVFLKSSVFSAFLEKSLGEYCFVFQI